MNKNLNQVITHTYSQFSRASSAISLMTTWRALAQKCPWPPGDSNPKPSGCEATVLARTMKKRPVHRYHELTLALSGGLHPHLCSSSAQRCPTGQTGQCWTRLPPWQQFNKALCVLFIWRSHQVWRSVVIDSAKKTWWFLRALASTDQPPPTPHNPWFSSVYWIVAELLLFPNSTLI